jgi:hypothetical protein
MMFSPLFPLLVVESDGFCAPIFNPTLNQVGNVGNLSGSLTYFCMVPVSALTLGGLGGDISKVRVTFQAGNVSPLRIERAFIGYKHSSTPYRFAGDTAYPLLFNGTDEGIVIPTNGTGIGEADFAWDKTTDLLIAFDFEEGTNSHTYATGVSGCRTFSTTAYDAADPQVPPPTCYVKETNLDQNGNGAQGFTYRTRIPAANLNLAGFTGPGDEAIFSMISSTSSGQGIRISKLYIGHAAASGHGYASAPTQCTFPNNGGGTTVNVGTQGTRVVAHANFAYDGVSDVIIAVSWATGLGNVGHRFNNAVTGETTYGKASSAEADAMNPSGFSPTSNYSWIERLEFYPRTCPLGLPPSLVTEGAAGYTAIKQIVTDGCGEPEEPQYFTKLLLNFEALPLVDESQSAHASSYINDTPLIRAPGFGGNPGKFNSNMWQQQATTRTCFVFQDHDDWDFADGDFTIEYWFWRTTSGPQLRPFITKRASPGNAYAPFEIAYDGTTASLRFYAASVGATSWDLVNGLSLGQTTAGFPHQQWYHYAVSREGDVWRTFRNGTLISSLTKSGTIQRNNAPLLIGGTGDTGMNPDAGYTDNLRISKGIARYTANFTAPTSPVTAD